MGVNAMGARKFRRRDGILGVGFFINWGGLRQASVAWPDGPAARYTEDQFELGTVELLGADETPAYETGETGETGETPGETPDETPGETPGETPDETPDETPAYETESESEESKSEPDSPAETSDVEPEGEKDPAGNTKTEAAHIREYLKANPEATNAQVIEHLKTISVEVQSSQVAYQRKRLSKNG